MPPLSPRTRTLVGAVVAMLVHAPFFVALRPARAEERAAAGDDLAVRRLDIRAERNALLRTAEPDIAVKRVTLGETLIRLGWLDHAEESLAPVDPAERDRALASYTAMLNEVRAAVARGEPVEHAIVAAVAHDGRAGRYKRMYPRLAESLANGGGNCVALSTLAVSLAHDADRGDIASFRVYANHVAPDVGGFHFGMVKRCHGEGVKLATRELIGAYAKARATADREPFAFPHSDDPCDDPGDVFGGLQLVGNDPPPMAAASAAAPPPALAPPPEADCKRRTVLEEYEEDVEAFGADGRTLGGVGIPRAASLDLAGHATSSACFDRRAAALGASSGADELVLALADAAMAAEDAARVFAAAGEIDVAREYDRRLSGHRARAALPLERVISRLGDPDADVAPILGGAGRLVALGEGGRTAMLLASERHRGFWELANLMTRPSAQVGALKRWSEKPIDVRIDVVDMLPCASEIFLAQVDSVALPASRALRAACEVRVAADKEPCVLADAVAHARRRAPANDRRAADLCEAVMVHRVSARCRTPAPTGDTRAPK